MVKRKKTNNDLQNTTQKTKDRQYNGQKKKDKMTNNDTHNITQKNQQHEPY